MLKRCIVYSIIRNYAYEINQERTQIRMIYSLTLRWLNTQKLPTEYSTDAVHVLTTAQSLKRCWMYTSIYTCTELLHVYSLYSTSPQYLLTSQIISEEILASKIL